MTDVQKQKVVEWIQQGLKLSEIQTRLDSELGVRLTYMEVKMLLAELELKPKDQEPAKAAATLGASPAAGAPAAAAPPGSLAGPAGPAEDEVSLPEDPAAGLGGNVAVTIDTITRPGSMVSGKVTFSDKKTADWYLDQYGRLGMAPAEKGYRPSQMDVIAFQNELQNQLAKMGM